MTKGIREFTEQRFTKYLPKAADMGPTAFRKKVMDETVARFDISVASAATAYNYVLRKHREEDPASVEGIGRSNADAQGGGNQGNKAQGGNRGQGNKAQGAQGGNQGQGQGGGNRKQTPAQAGKEMVTVVAQRTGDVVVESMPRKLAQDLIAASSGGRGRAKAGHPTGPGPLTPTR